MFDSISNSDMMSKLSTARSYYTHITNFLQDLALYIFATFLMDAILMTYHKHVGFGMPTALSGMSSSVQQKEVETFEPDL